MAAAPKHRSWLIGGLVAALVIAGGMWLFGIGPQRAETAAAKQRLIDAQTQNMLVGQRITALRNDEENIVEISTDLARLRAALPNRADLEGFTRQLADDARQAGVRLTSVTPGGTESAEPKVAEALTAIPVTVIASGPVSAQREFLASLQSDANRQALIGSVNLAPNGSGVSAADAESGQAQAVADHSDWTMTVQLQVFVAPASADGASAAAASPASEAGSS